MNNTKITILSRLRDESLLIPDFLNHIDKFGDEFFFLDDCSNDDSVDLLRSHPKTKKVLRNYFHSRDQSHVQTSQRKLLLDYARNHSKNKWFALIEPDERIVDFDFSKIDKYDKQGITGIYLQLLDGYLTPKYKKPYTGGKLEDIKRLWGVEMREIMFFFQKDCVDYDICVPGCRQPNLSKGDYTTDGWVKHFSKCISKEKYEADCDYYTQSMPMLAEKWKKRKGTAIKKDYKSDFGTTLYKWPEVKKHIIKI
ncbi:MAG: glycosyltransferase family 2 protein [Elusimicrobiota bacterium]